MIGMLAQGCSQFTIGGPPDQVPAGCVQVGAAESVAGLDWLADGSKLIIQGVGNPFASSSGIASIYELEWPGKAQHLLFDLPAGVLVYPTVADDGTVYWVEPDGIWARDADVPARRIVNLDGESVVDLRWTRKELLVLVQNTAGSAVMSVPLGGGELRTLIPPDPAAFRLWASPDASSIVVTRRPVGQTLEFVLHTNEQVKRIDPHTNSATFEWVAHGGDAVVWLDPTRGLVHLGLGDSNPGSIVGSGLPSDYWALSRPTSAGLIAYAGRDTSASNVCFSSALPAADLP